jgi:hypothetical protein
MPTTIPFKFVTGPASYDTAVVFYARLTSDLYTQEQLLEALYYLLWLPGYFGFNWNALYECLRDFHWISEKRVVLVHNGLPKLPADELKIYLEVLRDVLLDGRDDESHQVEVVFPEEDQTKVLNLLST